AGALLSLGSISDDGDKDDLKGGKGDDELIGGVKDKLKK
ncbi:MAG: calcium-binding protein, partial [Rhodopirellula sp.]|nr:calcium-binding protein [Rhodopirellula sp.]